ncbi:MAG: restriction endonuclease subunit S [Arcobacter sp.]|nr:restriction endonuclease subunit S [Arcobacter sp.]
MENNRLNLEDVEWKEFKVSNIFDVKNSKPYHKADLQNGDMGIQYITRTSLNNGLENIVLDKDEYVKNTKNTISLGAENADFFYHGENYICGNKMYIICHKNLNRFSGKFLVSVFRKSIKNCGFGYGKGLTGTRFKNRKILLPIDKKGNPNWQFMEDYIKQEQKKMAKDIINYYENKLNHILEMGGGQVEYQNTTWKVFEFKEIFRKIQRGKRLTKKNQIAGKIPYISSTATNNGVDNFISNEENIRKSSYDLSIANSGSVGACFYHHYEYIASDHITSLKLENKDENIYLFLSTIIKRLEEKYSFNREINDKRIKNEKLILPCDEKGNPNWQYMSDFIKNIQKENIEKTLRYIYIYISLSQFLMRKNILLKNKYGKNFTSKMYLSSKQQKVA